MYNESSGLVTWDREGLCVLEQSLITFLKNTGKVIKSAQSQQIKSNVMNGSVLQPPVPRAGKRAPGGKRGKTSSRCQARENEQLVATAGKRAADANRGKTRKSHSTMCLGFAPDRLRR